MIPPDVEYDLCENPEQKLYVFISTNIDSWQRRQNKIQWFGYTVHMKKEVTNATDAAYSENIAGNTLPKFVQSQRQAAAQNMRTVDFYVLLFFLLSFAGWLWETLVYLVLDHVLVNAGVYRGPYLPIYGTGGLLLWFLLHKLYRRPGWTFVLSTVICTIFEYIGSVFLEQIFGMRWWDYSDRFLNLDGRICFLAAVCFGLFGMLQNCFLLPTYMRLYHKLSVRKRWILCVVFSVFFILDITYCAVNPNINPQIESKIEFQK